jgi:Family of unknown function (DUF5678)
MRRRRPKVRPLPLPEILRGLEGKWVALRGDKVIEVGDTPDALLKRLRSRRIRDAVVMRAPSERDHDAELIGFG